MPFRVGDALEFGLSRSRLRASDLSSPYRGIRVAHVASSVEERAIAYNTVMRDDQFFSHTTAAYLLGMRLPERMPDLRLHVTSIAPRRAPRVAGVVGHKITHLPVLVRRGHLRVSHPLQVLLECSELFEIDELVAFGDGLICRKSPAITVERLDAAVRFHKGRRGHVALATAHALMRPHTDSPRETRLRLLLERAGFPEPEVNGEIRNAAGTTVAHGDIVYREFATVVEYDGGQHRTDARQFSIDIQRIDAIMELGWRHIRVEKMLIEQPHIVIGKVDAALRRGCWRGREDGRLLGQVTLPVA